MYIQHCLYIRYILWMFNIIIDIYFTIFLVPLLFLIVLVVVFWCVFFDFHMKEFRNPSYSSYNWFFLILTNETFDRILPVYLTSNTMYLLIFFSCIYIGQRFLLSLIIGDTYETYKSLVKKQLKKEKLK